MSTPQKPKFVNHQVGSVDIFNEARRRITVHPFSQRTPEAEAKGNIFIVEGEHYAQFCKEHGPLTAFRSEPSVASVAPSPVAAATSTPPASAAPVAKPSSGDPLADSGTDLDDDTDSAKDSNKPSGVQTPANQPNPSSSSSLKKNIVTGFGKK